VPQKIGTNEQMSMPYRIIGKVLMVLDFAPGDEPQHFSIAVPVKMLLSRSLLSRWPRPVTRNPITAPFELVFPQGVELRQLVVAIQGVHVLDVDALTSWHQVGEAGAQDHVLAEYRGFANLVVSESEGRHATDALDLRLLTSGRDITRKRGYTEVLGVAPIEVPVLLSSGVRAPSLLALAVISWRQEQSRRLGLSEIQLTVSAVARTNNILDFY
jgi:hypothetical protein